MSPYTPRPIKNPASQAKVDSIARQYRTLASTRALLEAEVREEIMRRQHDKEAAIAAQVLEAMQDPEITNRQLMIAIGKQSPARWREYLEKWGHLTPNEDEVILRELAAGEWPGPFASINVEQSRMYGDPVPRVFELTTWAFPHDTVNSSKPWPKVISYWPDIPDQDGTFDIRNVGNLQWANDPKAPIGPHRAEIREAILAWIESHPEAP